jgi:starch phosphorylase
MSEAGSQSGRIAYFTMEIGLAEGMHTYSGGLGILAGDTMRAFADLSVPAVGVTQLNDRGYASQRFGEDGTVETGPDPWSPEEFLDPVDVSATVPIEGREVLIKPWRYDVDSETGGTVPVYFLDTDWPDNDDEARAITGRLYGPGRGDRYRLAQEAVLGVGGVRILDELGYDVDTYHMNEGHASLLTLELLDRLGDPAAVRDRCAFTTHTPVDGGHDVFDYFLADSMLADIADGATLREYAGQDRLHTTRLALTLSGYANAVSKRHQAVSREMFPDHAGGIDAITNGVHLPTWVAEPFRELYDEFVPGWRRHPDRLRHARRIPLERFHQAHNAEKRRLIEYVEAETGRSLDPETPTLGFARRAAGYKRADLLFHDVDRLRGIALANGGLQVLFAGKAYPGDGRGEELIRTARGFAEELAGEVEVVYLPGYDMDLGARLTAGVDVWLNNPRRPYEACGTSGMKSAVNGVPHLSTVDGWWVEGHVDGVTGWSIGPTPDEEPAAGLDPAEEDALDAASLYERLDEDVLPTYQTDPDGWARIMRDAAAFGGSQFHARRMAEQYRDLAYRRD